MPKKPIQKVETIILSSIILIETAALSLYLIFEKKIFFHIFVIFLMLLYHLLVRVITPRVLMLIHRGKFNSDNLWFRSKKFEKPLYKFFRVKKWKDKLLTIEPESFSPRTNTLEGAIEMMCIAEILHIQLLFWSLIFILFGFVFGYFWIFILVGLLSACWEIRFVMAQRFNRPRIKALMLKRK